MPKCELPITSRNPKKQKAMKKYLKPLTKKLKMETEHSFLQSDISIHQEVGYPEDAANVGLF